MVNERFEILNISVKPNLEMACSLDNKFFDKFMTSPHNDSTYFFLN